MKLHDLREEECLAGIPSRSSGRLCLDLGWLVLLLLSLPRLPLRLKCQRKLRTGLTVYPRSFHHPGVFRSGSSETLCLRPLDPLSKTRSRKLLPPARLLLPLARLLDRSLRNLNLLLPLPLGPLSNARRSHDTTLNPKKNTPSFPSPSPSRPTNSLTA